VPIAPDETKEGSHVATTPKNPLTPSFRLRGFSFSSCGASSSRRHKNRGQIRRSFSERRRTGTVTETDRQSRAEGIRAEGTLDSLPFPSLPFPSLLFFPSLPNPNVLYTNTQRRNWYRLSALYALREGRKEGEVRHSTRAKTGLQVVVIKNSCETVK
jgi:hypothetical protein